MWPGANRRDQTSNWKERYSIFPRFNAARRESPGSRPIPGPTLPAPARCFNEARSERRDQGIEVLGAVVVRRCLLQCGPARFAGINGHTVAPHHNSSYPASMRPGMFAGIDEPLLRSLRQGQGQLQCGPARFAGISSSSAACVGIEYTARFNEARRESPGSDDAPRTRSTSMSTSFNEVRRESPGSGR